MRQIVEIKNDCFARKTFRYNKAVLLTLQTLGCRIIIARFDLDKNF